MEKISWMDCVRNEEELHTAKRDRDILHTTKRKKTNWISHILHTNSLLKHIIQGLAGGMK
jgi:hypothetical protein